MSNVLKKSDTLYEHRIAKKIKNEWANERIKKDKLNKLLKQNGFHIKWHGRAGTIYFIENGKVCEIEFEMSGVSEYDILIYFDSLDSWALPEKKMLTEKEKSTLRKKIIDWLNIKNIRAEL